MEVRQMNEQIRFLSDELRSRQTYRKIIGESEVMQRVYARINQVKDVDASVLITGESGTGKELVARAIHDEGKRKNERFVSINCAAIPERLLELELFGYRKGAFAGADQDRKGKLELAAKGTIFLNEIGDMPLKLQGKLLRVLREREFSPVGSTEVRHTDVRVIVATNQDLRQVMDQQKFRQDLYYRLNVIEIAMPSLRDRMGDVPLLCAHFLEETAAEMHKPVKTLTPAAREALMRYNYPGNVRQLATILEYATIVSTGEGIDVADLPGEITGGQEGQQPSSAALEQFLSSNNLKELERRAILATLKKNNGRRDKTAEDLGISKRGLLNKLNEYNIH
jgi:two-component system response regulator AtoC